jgi:hypothetical protein
MLVQPAAVDERLLDEVAVGDREAQPFCERSCWTHGSRVAVSGRGS